mmetsp:Transcript_33019/g.129662  ORF Transcript_33019/g.129662 Transcript_33019/m.129662 type:complete len:395 (-) Transcript_33019:1408-2592(-)|eukprot:CAMPEP_0113958158 /NCGR_PEP_ID=MMETSP0011_2-20120614/3209_1 /TAXON_ID=101924 /ORGANISM="Rhodosorus marinus" /LENGTH=394 /DNA_ID=CAMNT_0000968879 /DNA_START=323 /DNA_END=1507 /DNA_ORIENTATION=- /assembly_acc=CAM_ASM_000156
MNADWNRTDDGYAGNGIVGESRVRVLVSSYTDFDKLAHLPKGNEGQGIRCFTLDYEKKELRDEKLVSTFANPNPAFMRMDNDRLYVVNERIDENGIVSAFKVLPSGGLKLLKQLDAAGKSTCYVHKDRLSNFCLIVNYWDATVSVAKLDKDGSPVEITSVHRRPGFDYCSRHCPDRAEHLAHRQGWSHTHCVVPSPDDKFFFVPDLGEDKIHQFELNRDNGELRFVASTQVEEGHGPRHFIFHSDGNVAYAVNELDSTVDVLKYDANANKNGPALTVVQTVSTVAPGLKQKSHCAEIKLRPDGRFLYVANRFSDTIAIFAVQVDGDYKLSLVGIQSSLGCTPRHFSFYNNLMIVANTDNDSVVLFEVDHRTGLLQYTGKTYRVCSPNYVHVIVA